MALVVKEIELTDGIPDLHVPDGYSGFMIIVRFSGTPLGDFCIKANTGFVSSAYLKEQIAERFAGPIVDLWLQHQLSDDSCPEFLPPVDVAVCSGGDRLDDLERCVRSIADISYPGKSIILVDNGSQNEEVFCIAQKYGAQYIREKRRGVDFARNAALRAVKADLVLFTDDDVAVDPTWIHSMVRTFHSDPSVSCILGIILPYELETEAQELFEISIHGMKRGYQRRIYNRFDLPSWIAPKIGAGANMAYRTVVLRQVGGFDEALDCGTPAKAGGDVEMYYRLLMQGYKICYEPKVVVWHRHRKEMHELRAQLSGYAVSLYAFLTKCLVEYGDLSVLPVACSCFKRYYVKDLLFGLVGKGWKPLPFVLGEIRGAFSGPAAYLRAKAYASRIRLQEGSERRCRRSDLAGKPISNPSPAQCLGVVLNRLITGKRKARYAQRCRTHS